MIGLLGSLIGGRGGRMLGGMIGGRTGAMIGGLAGSLLGSRQLGRLGRSVFDRNDGGGQGGGRQFEPPAPGDPSDVLSDDNARLLVRVMCNSAKADGHVDQTEADRIMGELGDDVSTEERQFLQEQLAGPVTPAADLAREVPAELTAEAYAVSVLTVDIDTAAEADYLRALSGALGLSDADRAEIHTELGVDTI